MMNPGKFLRLKALLLLCLLLVQAATVLACAGNKHQGHQYHCHHYHCITPLHHCCNTASPQLLQVHAVTTRITAPATLSQFIAPQPANPYTFFKTGHPRIEQPAVYRHIPYRPIADIRIAIQSFQV